MVSFTRHIHLSFTEVTIDNIELATKMINAAITLLHTLSFHNAFRTSTVSQSF